MLRGEEEKNCNDRVLEQVGRGLDRGEIVGVAVRMDIAGKRNGLQDPQALEVYIPQYTKYVHMDRRWGRHD